MQRPLAGLTKRNLVTELTAGVTLLAIAIPLSFSRVRPPTRARLEELGLLSGQAFFATNRAAVAALVARGAAPED